MSSRLSCVPTQFPPATSSPFQVLGEPWPRVQSPLGMGLRTHNTPLHPRHCALGTRGFSEALSKRMGKWGCQGNKAAKVMGFSLLRLEKCGGEGQRRREAGKQGENPGIGMEKRDAAVPVCWILPLRDRAAWPSLQAGPPCPQRLRRHGGIQHLLFEAMAPMGLVAGEGTAGSQPDPKCHQPSQSVSSP